MIRRVRILDQERDDAVIVLVEHPWRDQIALSRRDAAITLNLDVHQPYPYHSTSSSKTPLIGANALNAMSSAGLANLRVGIRRISVP